MDTIIYERKKLKLRLDLLQIVLRTEYCQCGEVASMIQAISH